MIEISVYNTTITYDYTLSEAWSGVNWAAMRSAQFTPLQASDRVYHL